MMDGLISLVPDLQSQLQQTLLSYLSAAAATSEGSASCGVSADSQPAVGKAKAVLKNVTGQRIAKELGAVCQIFRLDLEWQWHHDRVHSCSCTGGTFLPSSVIIKLINVAEPSLFIQRLQEAIPESKERRFSLKMHTDECKFYEFCVDASPDIATPTFYGFLRDIADSQLIVLEDMSRRHGVIVDDISTSLTSDQLRNVTDALICFHAWCLNTDFDWQSRFPDRRTKFGDSVASLRNMLLTGLCHLKARFPSCAAVDEQAIGEFFQESSALQWYEATESLLPQVIVHGDLWTNNIMFGVNDRGVAGNDFVALLDWQLCFRGPMMEDLAHMMCFSVNAEIRHQIEETVLKYYCDQLNERLKSSAAKHAVTLAKVRRQYERCFRATAYLLISWLPAFFGTIVKIDVPNGKQRIREMVERALAAYTDATKFQC